jgi:aminopeptidase N
MPPPPPTTKKKRKKKETYDVKWPIDANYHDFYFSRKRKGICTTSILIIKSAFAAGAEQKEEEFVFSDIHERPVPSLLRGFSAPVRLESDLSDSDLFFLLAHDSDDFNRFDFL